MASLPPIRSSVLRTDVSLTSSQARTSTADAVTLPPTTTASTSDGINRNRLRQEAGRRVQHITCGVAEQQTYLDMLKHIRGQFAHTSQEPLRPLVLPPQSPSTARPREPQVAKFSRGIALCKKVNEANAASRKTSDAPPAAALTLSTEETQAAANENEKRSASTTAAHHDSTREKAVVAPSEADTELPSTTSGFVSAHRWEAMDTSDRAYFRRVQQGGGTAGASWLMEEDATQLCAQQQQPQERRLSATTATPMDGLSPLDALPTFAEKCAYLVQLEEADRQHVLAYQTWDQQVLAEMMAVHFVTFVLKPYMDALRLEEAEQREKIKQTEELLSFSAFHESPLALQIREGVKVLKARELQLDRILGMTPPRQPSVAASQADSTAHAVGRVPASDAIRSLALTPERNEQHGGARTAEAATPTAASLAPRPPSRGGSGSIAHGSSTTAIATHDNRNADQRASLKGGEGTSAEEARRILHQYVRQRHGQASTASFSTTSFSRSWAQPALATYPAVSGASDAIRRPSVLVLPPTPTAHAPRRNAVGIADYVALLDEWMGQRDQLVRTEETSRSDLNRTFYEESQVVLEWQRRRMHLERLLYWRRQREAAVQVEMSALTVVNVVAPLDPEVLFLLEVLTGEEDMGREELCAEEAKERREELWTTAAELRHDFEVCRLRAECWATLQEEVLKAEQVSRLQLLLAEETSLRACHEESALRTLRVELDAGMSSLRKLWVVSTAPKQYAALCLLQGTFRRSLRRELGWRATNVALGREVNDTRNRAKIKAGKQSLQAFRDELAAEAAQLSAEQNALHVQAQCVLCAGEAADRVAVSAQQDMHFHALARLRIRDVEKVFVPLLKRTELSEAESRLQWEVEGDLDREALYRSNIATIKIIHLKEDSKAAEASSRKALVLEERDARRDLAGEELDEHELLRLDAEAAETALQEVREAFAQRTFETCRAFRARAFADATRVLCAAKMELFDRAADDDATRRQIAEVEATAMVNLCRGMSTQACETLAHSLLSKRQRTLDQVHRQALFISETERRAQILLAESAALTEMRPHLQALLAGPLQDLINRRCAVNVISKWYTAILHGDVSRAVTQQHLREDLARHREERQLRAQRAQQRLHTQHVQSQLDLLMQDVHREQVEACQQLLNILVLREEPREREQVESLQDIVFGIILRNAQSQKAETRRQLVNTEALLWQEESYDRKRITQAHQRALRELRVFERQQLREDFFARRIQNVWRAYLERTQRQRLIRQQCAQLEALERQARIGVARKELTERALRLVKPCEARMYHQAHFYGTVQSLYTQVSKPVMMTTARQEWQQRAVLLWEMRCDLCDSCLCVEEAHARSTLEADFDKPFLLQEALLHEEQQQRRGLAEERTAFLLRVLAREEHARRQEAGAAETKAWSTLTAQLHQTEAFLRQDEL